MKSYFPTVPGSCHVAPSVKDNIFPYRLRYSNMGSPLPAVGGDTLLTASPPPVLAWCRTPPLCFHPSRVPTPAFCGSKGGLACPYRLLR